MGLDGVGLGQSRRGERSLGVGELSSDESEGWHPRNGALRGGR